jgi:hypothetical protein
VQAQKSVVAIKTDCPPQIDGKLIDPCWESAAKIDEFYQREPKEGEPATEKTEVFICYDTNNLYFGFKCFDDPKKITAKELARDVSLRFDDRIQIILDTYNDHRNAYWFQVGPRGSIGDAIISENGAAFNKQWDGLWTGKSNITENGWVSEIAIPFKTMGFDEGSKKWGLKLIRHIVNKLESVYWPIANLNTHNFQVSDAGILNGLDGITQGIGLDISPYLLTGIDASHSEKNKGKLTGGTDIFYQITPSLKASLSINTDFAETEVDDRQINLTRFGLHYPEKRDFFLDGSNYFQFGIESDRQSPVATKLIPFFSRQMGLDENGTPIPINIGAKLTGQVNNWNIGLMHINDNREVGNSDFTVGRVTRNIGEQSSVGFIGTYGNSMNDNRNVLMGIDAKISTSKFQKNKNISLIFFGLKSNTKNRTGNNTAWGTQFVYPNDFINARLGYHQIGENFVAGIGFVPRTNIRETYGELEFGPRLNKLGIMQIQFGGQFDYVTNFENKIETREFKLNPLEIRFLSGEEISYSIVNQFEAITEDFNIFENFIVPKDDYSFWWQLVQLETKGARDLWGEISYGWGNFYNGKRKDIELEANWKVAIPFFIGGKLTRSHVELPQGNFTANIYQVNANFLFSPEITLYNYFQYDNATKSASWQSRFQWILKPGNEIILAWTSGFFKPQSSYIMEESSLRLKLKYNIRF